MIQYRDPVIRGKEQPVNVSVLLHERNGNSMSGTLQGALDTCMKYFTR